MQTTPSPRVQPSPPPGGATRLTGALLDRLTHHVHILEMNGDSYRLNQSRKRPRSAALEPGDPARPKE